MNKMWDGSEMIPVGTYVRVRKREIRRGEPPYEAIQPARTFYARIVGTDMGRSKYEIGERYGGWGRWLFLDGGSYAFIGEVEVLEDQDEALRPPAQES